MRLFLAHHACASFVTAPTLGQTALGLATACATSVVLSVRVSVQRHTNQQLVRATIGALVLGCPPLGNSCTRSYHAIGRYQSGRQLHRKCIMRVQFYLQRKFACASVRSKEFFAHYIFTQTFFALNLAGLMSVIQWIELS